MFAGLLVLTFLTGRFVESFSAYGFLVILVGVTVAFAARKAVLDAKRALAVHSRSYLEYRFEDSMLESAEWLNIILRKVWNTCHVNFDEYMRETLDPWLDYYRPSGCSSFSFSKFELGANPPVFRSIRIHRCTADCHDAVAEFDTFQMDVDLEYRSSGTSVAVAKMGLLKVPIAIKDLSVEGKMRLIISVDSENYVRVAHVSFLGKPDVDVTIKPLKGLDIMGVPGLASWLNNLITEGIGDFMSWPKRYTYDVADWAVPTAADLARKRLTVRIHAGRSLAAMDSDGSSDPFVVVTLGDVDPITHKTRVLQSTLAPIWNESFTFYVTDVRPLWVHFHVFDEDRVLNSALTKTTPMGSASLSLQAEIDTWLSKKKASVKLPSNTGLTEDFTSPAPASSSGSTMPTGLTEKPLEATPPSSASDRAAPAPDKAEVAGQIPEQQHPIPPAAESASALPESVVEEPATLTLLNVTKWVALEKADSGEIQVSLELETTPPDDVPVPGMLTIRLIKAENLQTTKSMIIGKKPTCNSYVTFRVGEETHSSGVKKKTSSPVWEETFYISVSDVRTEQLFIQVSEKETIGRDKQLGDTVVPLQTLTTECLGQSWFTLHNATSGRLHLEVHFESSAVPTGPRTVSESDVGSSSGSPSGGALHMDGGVPTVSTSAVRTGFSRCGYLEKRSDFRHVWQSRWCTMSSDGNVLYYFENDPRDPAVDNNAIPYAKAKGQVMLKGATVARSSSMIEGFKARAPRAFSIKDTRKTFYFAADSVEDRDDWLAVLESAMVE